MCGIAGWAGHVNNRERIASLMKQGMLHRGPDAQRIRHWDDDVTLIHNRLKIIDLSENAAQPMCNEDQSVWIIFNGEIYNHRQLRKSLEAKGHVFKSHSDTEAIIHLYEEFGIDFPKHLKGMFAIALYDSRINKLILARDRFGIKPLFYYKKDDSFLAFASELNTLKRIEGIDLAVDRQSIFDYTAYFYIPAPGTFYKHIKSLLPGTLMEIGTGENASPPVLHEWYRLSVNIDDTLTVEEAADKASRLIEKAVNSQLESDVRLGSLLSGGIDSSLVSYYAQKNIHEPLNTFNVKFPDEKYDESWAAIIVAESIHSNHQTLAFNLDSGTWDSIVELLRHVGQPYADTSIFAMSAVSRLMKEHVTVALSGDGGDESFGGYTIYNEIEQIHAFNRLPTLFTAPIAAGIKMVKSLDDRLNRYNRILSHFYRVGEVGVIENIFRWIRDPEHQQLWNHDKTFLPVGRFIEQETKTIDHLEKNSIERLSAFCSVVGIKLTLLNDFLVKVDTASMKESLEVRVPMLDEDLFEFGMTFPHRLKTHHKELKHVLRTVARKVLPENIANKPKWGFSIPMDKWVDHNFKHKLQEYLLSPKNPIKEFLNYDVYKVWVEAFCNDTTTKTLTREGLYQRMIMLLSLSLHLEDPSQARR